MVASVSSSNHTSSSGCSARDVDALRRSNSSGFLNVYPAGTDLSGVRYFKAKVKRAGRTYTIPGSRNPEAWRCAQAVVQWLKEEFGDDWRRVLEQRKHNAFAVRYSAKYGGFVAAVWVMGQREEVVVLRRRKRDLWEPTARLAVFATKDGAREGIKRYMRLRYGLLSPFVQYRA